MVFIFAVITVLFLAYANGANDNFKGVATLLGSGTSDYRKALLWGTLTTAAGSLTALVLAQGLLASFSGRGLVPQEVVAMKGYQLSVVLAAAVTVISATKFGIPVSTTHALTGALVGAGLLASSSGVNFGQLRTGFFAPLLVSPLLAVILTFMVYPLLRFVRARLNVTNETCVCVGTEIVDNSPQRTYRGNVLALTAVESLPLLTAGNKASCRERYTGKGLVVSAKSLLDGLHYLSGGIVSFARGINDTPKIAAILLAGNAISPLTAIVGVTLFIAAGGILSARPVAEIMAYRVTRMNAGQGVTANLVTGFLVIFASRLGLPVSTTHVSCGSLFGIGAATGQGHWRVIAGILLAWFITLPVAALLGAVLFVLVRRLTG